MAESEHTENGDKMCICRMVVWSMKVDDGGMEEGPCDPQAMR